jgi:UDP-N-acetylmuramate dehydrogenase
MTGALDALVDEGLLSRDVPLGPLTTYRFGGPARYLMEASGEADVLRLARALAEDPIPVVTLGRGSNVVVSSQGFPGVVVHAGPAMSWFHADPAGPVEAGAALPLPLLARRSSEAGRGGLEFYVGIPGSVGGAVRMNAGCLGNDTAQWMSAARVVHISSAEVGEHTSEDLEMRYRHSNVTADDVVVSASFGTVERDPAECEETMREVTRWRKEHQPGGTLNAGSVFKNPPGDSAGRMIDELGLKGFGVGGARVSERHANFFVAGPGATPQDVFDLVRAVRDRVRTATGIDLQPEVQFLGPFAGEGA